MDRFYTGIGSRQCPVEICQVMTGIAYILYSKDYILRSGGADGADSAFEEGAGDRKEIYLPWKKFNGNTSPLFKPTKEAFELAATIHPVWEQLSYGAKCLHARNCHQVLGLDLQTPSEFLICWTLGGGERGGTATAMKLAKQHDIPVINLAVDNLKDIEDLYDR
jgi:hypothetical protein